MSKPNQPKADSAHSPELADAVANTEVTNLGDVTQPIDNTPVPYVAPVLSPLSELPKGYESLAEDHPKAKGFVKLGRGIALKF